MKRRQRHERDASDQHSRRLTEPRARVGLIIPSVNTYSEPQFNHFAPDGLGIHVARARVAGQWKRPLPGDEGRDRGRGTSFSPTAGRT